SGMDRSPEHAVRLRQLARERQIEDSLVWTGFLPDAECRSLLRHALVFLAPSRGEGFDLPALEAMACGIPVVCSDIPVHRELLAGCATFFDPDAAASLAAALGRCV